MSRYERDLRPAADAPPSTMPSDEREAIACFLSAGEGWGEAQKALQGAFANAAIVTAPSSLNDLDNQEINHRASEYLQWPGLKSAWTDND